MQVLRSKLRSLRDCGGVELIVRASTFVLLFNFCVCFCVCFFFARGGRDVKSENGGRSIRARLCACRDYQDYQDCRNWRDLRDCRDWRRCGISFWPCGICPIRQMWGRVESRGLRRRSHGEIGRARFRVRGEYSSLRAIFPVRTAPPLWRA